MSITAPLKAGRSRVARVSSRSAEKSPRATASSPARLAGENSYGACRVSSEFFFLRITPNERERARHAVDFKPRKIPTGYNPISGWRLRFIQNHRVEFFAFIRAICGRIHMTPDSDLRANAPDVEVG